MARNQEQKSVLDNDLSLLMETLDEVLQASGSLADETYQEIKGRAEQALKDVKSRLGERNECSFAQVKDVVCCTHDYVRNKPWCSVGIGATAGVILGLLIARR